VFFVRVLGKNITMPQNTTPPEVLKKAIELYTVKEWSIDKISFEVGIKRSRLNTLLKNAGVQLRSTGRRPNKCSKA